MLILMQRIFYVRILFIFQALFPIPFGMENDDQSVNQILHRDYAAFINPESSVYEAALKMSASKTGSVLVLDSGKLKGIFTERDLMNRVVVLGRDYRKTPVHEVMTMNVKSVPNNESIHNCYKLMRANGCRHLPVFDEKENILGVVTIRDILNFLIHNAEDENRVLKQYISA